MISPFKYRLGIELACDAIRAVLVEPGRSGCALVDAMAFERPDSDESSEENVATLLKSTDRIIPDGGGAVLTSLVLPADRVIESNIRIPTGLKTDMEDWECWEVSSHLPGSSDNYWFESSHMRDSVCGKFRVRKIRAARKQFVQFVLKAAARVNLFIDRLFFPQPIWGSILQAYCLSEGSTKLECVYLGERLSYVLRVTDGMITSLSPVWLPADGDVRQFVDTVATLLSWHGGGSEPGARRIIIDGGGTDEAASALSSTLGFSEFDSRPISKLVHGGVGRPERFLLPLAALGVI